jgi:hypothetical protein
MLKLYANPANVVGKWVSACITDVRQPTFRIRVICQKLLRLSGTRQLNNSGTLWTGSRAKFRQPYEKK